MNTSWWRNIDDLTQNQRNFIRLPTEGRLLLVGPPGSGKTNLLLLRAEYLSGSGFKNILVITYGKSLANFIRSGIGAKRRIEESQIKTYHSWACDHIYQQLGTYPEGLSSKFSDETRAEIVVQLKKANAALPSSKIYDAIFVDEAQDLTEQELELLLELSENISICGDGKQGIYNKNGLNIAEKLGLEVHTLTEHFRIGHAIARVADKILKPANAADLLEATSNYDNSRFGDAIVTVHDCESSDIQFQRMIEAIRVQLDAYPNETIGVICASKETRRSLSEYFDETEIRSIVCVHGIDEASSFAENRVHVLTAHSSKGTEYRAVHIFAAEEFATGLFRRSKLSYTAITRAKSSLNIYKTGRTTPALESALAKPELLDLEDLF